MYVYTLCRRLVYNTLTPYIPLNFPLLLYRDDNQGFYVWSDETESVTHTAVFCSKERLQPPSELPITGVYTCIYVRTSIVYISMRTLYTTMLYTSRYYVVELSVLLCYSSIPISGYILCVFVPLIVCILVLTSTYTYIHSPSQDW